MSFDINLSEHKNQDLLDLVQLQGKLVSSKVVERRIVMLYSIDHFLIETEYSMDHQKMENMRIIYDMNILGED
jgi:hypothetical protein